MSFTLEIPDEEEVKMQVKEELAPTKEEVSKISNTVDSKTKEIMSVNLDSLDSRKELSDVFGNFGMEVLSQSERKNAILEKRMISFGEQGGESGIVAKGLEDLTIKMKDLDPSGIDFVKKGKLGNLFNPARRYFERYKTADQEIDSIIQSLDNGKKTLLNDNITLEIEQVEMRKLTKQLNQSVEMGAQLDVSISNAVENAKAEGKDPDKIKFIEEEILYPLRQRIVDFQQLQTVNQQGIIAMELIRRNNAELVRSVDRAKMVTVNALRTAVMVASALYDQKIVLEKVTAVNVATNNMISATAKMLHEQGTEIQRQASESAISADTLKEAFNETLQALDDISTYKQEALPKMKNTIAEFKKIAEDGEKRISQLEKSMVHTLQE